MTPKQTALIQVGKIIGSGIAGGITIWLLINHAPMVVIGSLFMAGLIAFLLKMLYDMELDKAQRRATIQDRLNQIKEGA